MAIVKVQKFESSDINSKPDDCVSIFLSNPETTIVLTDDKGRRMIINDFDNPTLESSKRDFKDLTDFEVEKIAKIILKRELSDYLFRRVGQCIIKREDDDIWIQINPIRYMARIDIKNNDVLFYRFIGPKNNPTDSVDVEISTYTYVKIIDFLVQRSINIPLNLSAKADVRNLIRKEKV